MSKDEVEARPRGEGFVGAWYKAILIDKSAEGKAQVSFMELEGENGSLLRETINTKFVRPLPPENLFTSEEFEEGCVVEAFHRDGWWTCVFVKKLEEEEDKYLVYFDSPPDLICFKRKQLRQHYDWNNRKWVRPKNKHLRNGKCGTVVEVMEEMNDGVVCWIPLIVVKEIENGRSLIVKSSKYLSWSDEIKPTRTVSSSKVRSVPALVLVGKYQLMNRVEVFFGPGWRQGIVYSILVDDKYIVRLNVTKELLKYHHSEIRPLEEPVTSQRLMVNAAVTPQQLAKTQEYSRKRNREHKHDSTLNKAGKTCNGSKALIIDSSNDEDEDQPLSSILREKSSTSTVRSTSAMIYPESRANEDTPIVLPFAKHSPLWKEVESLEALKTVKQSPHFSPLLGKREELREGIALGAMVNFSSLLERVKSLRFDAPQSTLEGLKESFSELEEYEYGFDIKAPLSRINLLISLKDREVNIAKELNVKEKEMEEGVVKKQKVEEELRDVVCKFSELRKQEADLKEKKKASEKEIAEIQSCASALDSKIQDVELEFVSIVSAPW